MKTIMARSPLEASFSLSRRYFKWPPPAKTDNADSEAGDVWTSSFSPARGKKTKAPPVPTVAARLRAAFRATIHFRRLGGRGCGLGHRTLILGTVYGHRSGLVRLAFQVEARATPALLLELPAPTSSLVTEMSSGVMRIVLECDRRRDSGGALTDEPAWLSWCNGRKLGYAARREAGESDRRVLRALEPVTTGAGVMSGACSPSAAGGGDVMYMRARYERVVGGKDSEALYMLNPDSSAGPELSVYLLRV